MIEKPTRRNYRVVRSLKLVVVAVDGVVEIIDLGVGVIVVVVVIVEIVDVVDVVAAAAVVTSKGRWCKQGRQC